MTQLRAGTARLMLEPPLGLPMVGFVRQPWNARGYGLPLEVGALVLERGDTRIVLCGVDVVGIIQPQIEPLARPRRASDRRRSVPGSCSTQPHAPRPARRRRGRRRLRRRRRADAALDRRVLAGAADKVVSACRLAAERLEPAAVVWGQADVDLAVNRRERTEDGSTAAPILGWNPDELVDNQVTVLQARRPDESADRDARRLRLPPGHDAATTWTVYSADFPGPMRDVVRAVTGGECIFFQGAAGNVLPKFAFTDDEEEAARMGTRLGARGARRRSPTVQPPCRRRRGARTGR